MVESIHQNDVVARRALAVQALHMVRELHELLGEHVVQKLLQRLVIFALQGRWIVDVGADDALLRASQTLSNLLDVRVPLSHDLIRFGLGKIITRQQVALEHGLGVDGTLGSAWVYDILVGCSTSGELLGSRWGQLLRQPEAADLAPSSAALMVCIILIVHEGRVRVGPVSDTVIARLHRLARVHRGVMVLPRSILHRPLLALDSAVLLELRFSLVVYLLQLIPVVFRVLLIAVAFFQYALDHALPLRDFLTFSSG